ncbi:hypothetical protein PYCCODRAFT_1105664 [Trametes coccinea BRFM310]|uniref:C2H2-type domain-containing protein n=1 Tax=Trametes coccinea (strain BRFM310) TaxID=1353009 RepID=A0A1Y2I9M3_TRAC3|nr:hypothetical protein PYCCODRAFT_1105664 [Trametes coccinea BRFM310]
MVPQHNRPNMDARRHPCPHCTAGSVFIRRSNLDLHVRTMHERFRPHPCPAPGCTRTFSRRHDLTRHVVVAHSGLSAAPVVTAVGPATSQAGDTGRPHHTSGRRPYACGEPGCPRVFARRHNLNIHVKDVHAGYSAAPATAAVVHFGTAEVGPSTAAATLAPPEGDRSPGYAEILAAVGSLTIDMHENGDAGLV